MSLKNHRHLFMRRRYKKCHHITLPQYRAVHQQRYVTAVCHSLTTTFKRLFKHWQIHCSTFVTLAPFTYTDLNYSAASRRCGDIVPSSSVRPSVRMWQLYCLHDNSKKYLSNQLQIFVGTVVGTLGQHEFAFGFCGSTRSIARAICALRTLVTYLFTHLLLHGIKVPHLFNES